MQDSLTRAKAHLLQAGHTCVLCRGDTVITDNRRGVRPLLELLQQGSWDGFCAADKVVGKAAAFLYRCMGVHAVYAQVISQSAAQVLHSGGILLEYDTMVPAIQNRSQTGFCPMETAVLHTDDPQEARNILQTLVMQQK